jgi:biotin carboxyl carrier protein
MKMENEITAHLRGKITDLKVSEGGSVNSGDPIATIE